MDDKRIIIMDWTGKTLYEGDYDDTEVDEVLDANRCNEKHNDIDVCHICDDTGYWGDFEVYWVDADKNENKNVYEYIYY